MIAKIIPRKNGVGSFKDSVNYNLGLSRNDTDKVEYVNTLNIFEPSVAIQEMGSLALENTRSKDPVFNCILSWRENEIPSREQADEAVNIVLAGMGLSGCQTHYALHRNTQNLHLHICVNRIDPETYKARDPAHGWTKKALEKAARKIEFSQGWEIEQTGRYAVTESGDIVEKVSVSDRVFLSQTARDIEAHTAAKSAERIAQETAAPIIRAAKSWEELHLKLAAAGIAFEKKGSGAILRVGEAIVKASQAGRETSLSKLEKRLGAFQAFDGVILPRTEEPVEKVVNTPKVNSSWSRYIEAKRAYFKSKKSALAELSKQQRTERDSFFKKQRAERQSVFAVSWKGRGAELNQHRSVIASEQKKAKLDMSDRQRLERETLNKRFQREFPSFKMWLSMDDDPELLILFRHPEQPVISGAGGETPYSRGKSYDLRDYSPVFKGKCGVKYCKEGSPVADFIDYGKTIVFPDSHNEESVTAAMQLAVQKWGAVQVNGSGEYKRLCVKIAAKLGVRIVNPELAVEMEETIKNERLNNKDIRSFGR